jgi:hypothetical protein
MRNFFAEPVEKPTDSKTSWCFAPRLTLGLDESQLAPADLHCGTGPSKQKGKS